MLQDNTGSILMDREFEIEFVARYYPYVDYRETRPCMAPTRHDDPDDDDEDEGGKADGHIINIFWQGRKLPQVLHCLSSDLHHHHPNKLTLVVRSQALYNKMFFFPSLRRGGGDRGCGDSWDKRLSVSVFVSDWEVGERRCRQDRRPLCERSSPPSSPAAVRSFLSQTTNSTSIRPGFRRCYWIQRDWPSRTGIAHRPHFLSLPHFWADLTLGLRETLQGGQSKAVHRVACEMPSDL
jgi:hypothetical protein